MLETPHVAVGAAIASKIPNPLISVPLALASHFVLDSVPHWNPHGYTEIKRDNHISRFTTIFALCDVGLALTLGFFIASKAMPNLGHALTIILASFASVVSDVSKAPFFLLGVRKGPIKKWVDFERSLQVETKNIAWGIFTQLAIIAASLRWIS